MTKLTISQRITDRSDTVHHGIGVINCKHRATDDSRSANHCTCSANAALLRWFLWRLFLHNLLRLLDDLSLHRLLLLHHHRLLLLLHHHGILHHHRLLLLLLLLHHHHLLLLLLHLNHLVAKEDKCIPKPRDFCDDNRCAEQPMCES